MRPDRVAVAAPAFDHDASLRQRVEDLAVEKFIAQSRVEGLDEPRIVKWWRPDAIMFDSIPLTATGKIDKKVLRQRYVDRLRKP